MIRTYCHTLHGTVSHLETSAASALVNDGLGARDWWFMRATALALEESRYLIRDTGYRMVSGRKREKR